MNGVFITGSDTDVGKTYFSCRLIDELVRRNIKVIPRKPVETGCIPQNNTLVPADARKLLDSTKSTISIDEVCPNRFEPAISPQLAARAVDSKLNLNHLVDICTVENKPGDFVLVEGAGGFLSPICNQALNADLAKAISFPLVLLVNNRVGAVNQALLTVKAIEAYQLKLAAIILSSTSPVPLEPLVDNRTEIEELLDYPVLSLGYQSDLSKEQFDSLIAVISR